MIDKPLVGEWELTLPNTEDVRHRIEGDEISDVLLVITSGSRTPEWPV